MGRGKHGEFDLKRVPEEFLEGREYSNSLERFRRIYSPDARDLDDHALSRQSKKLVKRHKHLQQAARHNAFLYLFC